MKIKNKLKDNNGSAMVLAIILIVLVSIVLVIFSGQISNGFNITNKNYKNLKMKYMLEAGIEHGIASTCTKIQNRYLNWRNSATVEESNPGGELIGNKDVTINISVPKIEKNSENLKYIVESVNFDILVKIDSYKIGNKEYKDYLKSVQFNSEGQKIIVRNGDTNKKIEAIIDFKIVDLSNGTVDYTIKSWKKVS